MLGMKARSNRWATARAAAATCLVVLAAAGVTGCYARAAATASIQIAAAYVPQPVIPGQTVAYVVIRNNGPRDRLVGARTSVGGQVAFRASVGQNTAMHTIPSISIPANSIVRLVPDGLHMLITGAGAMRGGKDITITLIFAHAGSQSVVAQVTNPESGGSSYFLN